MSVDVAVAAAGLGREDRMCLLSEGQLAIWLGQMLDPASAAYNVGEYLEIAGPVDRDLLETALRFVVDTNDALRARFIETEHGPRQILSAHPRWWLTYFDLEREADPRRVAETWMRAELDRVFDLAAGPLFSFALFRIADDRYYWFARYHHLCIDGASVAMIAQRVAEAYSALAEGRVPIATAGSWLDVLEEEERYRTSAQHALDAAFWSGELRARPEPATFSGKPPAQPRGFVLRTRIVPSELAMQLHEVAARHRTKLTQIIAAATALYTNRITAAEEVMLGIAVSGRGNPRVRPVAGTLAKMLPLRLRVSPRETVGTFIDTVVTRTRAVLDHQRTSEIALRRDAALLPDEQLYGANVNVMAFDYDLSFAGHRVIKHALHHWRIHDLDVIVYDGAEMRIDFVANAATYGDDELEVHQERFVRFLARFARAREDEALYRVSLGEGDGGGTPPAQPAGRRRSVDAFEEQAVRTPHATALIAGDVTVTYAELNERADALAQELVARGAGPERIVGIERERDIDFVVALLATWKAGAAYLPLDPRHPQARRDALIAETQCLLPGTPASSPADAGGVPRRRPHERQRDAAGISRRDGGAPTNTAVYILYTSGSTGTPKGVVVEHAALAHKIATLNDFLGITPATRYAVTTSINFDPLLEQLLCPLTAGATAVLVPDDIRDDAQRFAAYAKQHAITVFDASPALLESLLHAGDRTLRFDTLLIGGDVLPPHVASALLDAGIARRALNIYGPTEACIDATSHEIESVDGPIPIGRELPGYRIHILDAMLEPVPHRVTGELYIAGPGLARGYHGRPALTAERFVADPRQQGARMYRTGDLARRRADGTIDFVGRADQQIKLRGFRIEPGEIEALLLAEDAVAQAVVIARGSQLVAYVVAKPYAAIDRAALRDALAARLPAHMVPSAFVVLPRLPLTSAGKVDRKNLPEPERPAESYRAPRNAEEEILCRCFAEVLRLDRIGIADNFFAHGGDSILSMQLVTRARRAGLELTPRDVFERMTVEALATVCKRAQAAPRWNVADATGDVAPTPIMRGVDPALRFHQSMSLPVPDDADVDAALRKLLDTHDALRMHAADGRLWIAERGSGAPLVETTIRDGRLHLAIHHLAVDGVSWRILLPDLEAALRGEELEPATTPFRVWARALQQHDAGPERALWEQQLGAQPFTGTLDRTRDTFATAQSIEIALPVEITHAILTRIPSAFHARIDDILLAALVTAIGRDVTVDLESHGRDGALDVSRTVGWFTTLFPVRLGISAGLPHTVKRVKEQLRAIPNRGIGFGLLGLESNAQIGFNYLGRFDEHTPLGIDLDPRLPLFHLLDINAQTLGERLTATWTFSPSLISESEVRAIAERWRDALEALAQLEGEWHTPSDFPLLDLTQSDVDRFEAMHAIDDLLPLSPLQQGMVFHTRYDEHAPDLYTVQLVLDLEGPLDRARLRKAAHALLQRHASLRAAVIDDVQVIARDVELAWQEADSIDALDLDRTQRFDLTRAPLIRFTLVALAPERHVLAITNHHLLMDGWSMPLFLGELLALDRGEALPHARPYRDYLAWIARQDGAAALDAWRTYLAGIEEPLHLAPRGGAFVPGHWRRELDITTTRTLQAFAREHALTLNTLVQGLWAILLGHLTGAEEVLFGATVSERPAEIAGVEQIVGLMINTVPVRVTLRAADTLRDLLTSLQRTQSRMLPHTHLGLAAIQQAVGLGELFDTLVVFENYPLDREAFNGGTLRIASIEANDASSYPLTLIVLPGERLQLRIEHDASRITREFAESIGTRLVGLFEQVTANLPLHALQLIDADERARVLATFNDTASETPSTTLPQMFEAEVQRTPDAIAITCGAESISYANLNTRANRLAHALIARGARPETLIAVSIPRSIEMVIAMLAVLKSGAGYLPIDPDYPEARRADILADAQPLLVLTDIDGGDDDRNPIVDIDAQHISYVIYTSGSTGRPKGVVLPQQTLVNLMTAHGDPGRGGKVVQFTSMSFDVSLQEILFALLAGRALVVVDAETRMHPDAFAQFLHAYEITDLFAPNLVVDLLAQSELALPLLQNIHQAGEALELTPRLRSFFSRHPHCRLHNHYGPAETHVVTATTLPRDVEAWPEKASIGGPIANTRAYVLDRHLQPVPPGILGEVYLAGAGLGRGYLHRAARTAERFVANPFEPGARMYRTGDLARWSEAGELDFAGRADHQVKIRGFRIEPGEIEAVLRQCSGVTQAAVLARDSQLIAYVAGGAEVETLRRELARRLPDFMVPAAFVAIDTLPLTPNGKLDRKALPSPERKASGRAPRTREEAQLCAIFAEVLAIDRIGIDDDFFALGGHSLLAMRAVSRIRAELHCELSIRALFETPRIADLAASLELATTHTLAPTPQPRPERIPLSYAQQRLRFLAELEGPSATYNLPCALRLRGEIDPHALQLALADVVERHESLRTIFPNDAQHIINACPLLVRDECDESELHERLSTEARKPIDVRDELPLRARLYRVRPSFILPPSSFDHVLLLVFHHIATDGWSLGITMRDLARAYGARRQGAAPDWTPLPLQYADYAIWQRTALDARMSAQLDFWRNALAGAPEELQLPLDRKRPAVTSYRGAWVPLHVDATLHARLQRIATESNASLFMLLHAALGALLSRLGAGDDIPIGTIVAGRNEPALEDLIGFFVNTLALRTDVSGAPSFRELVARVRAFDLAAYEHQDVPFERVVDALQPARSLSRQPLFQVLLALQNIAPAHMLIDGIRVDDEPLSMGVAKFDLAFELRESADGIDGAIEYSEDLFDRATIERMATQFVRLLDLASTEPDVPLHALPLVSDDERDALFALGTGPSFPLPHATLTQLVDEQALLRPNAIALIDGDLSLTYAQLIARVELKACELSEPIVIVQMQRSAEAVIAMLAAFQAGKVYLPIDPAYPAARIAMMREAARNAPELDAAYIIYTSGSTGRPKGVVVPHDGIVNLALAQIDRLGITAESRVLQLASLGFDASVSEIAMTLAAGATLVIAPEEARAGDALSELLRRERITHATFPPAVLASIAEDVPVEALIVAGEACPEELITRWSRGRRMINAYGPTETTVCATMSDALTGDGAPPIGRPLPHTRVYVLDRNLRLAPFGVEGELYVAGLGLARGYHGNPALTAERFVADPFASGERMYRTGDLARWRPDGMLEFHGRADSQVKVRGVRVELAEVETVLLAHERVVQAVVTVWEQQLVAYVAGDAVTESELRAHLAERLPESMVPAFFVVLAALPLTRSGKIDRRALPPPSRRTDDYRAPRTPEERILCEIIAETLALPRVGIDDNFFAIGGDSIQSIQVIGRARKAGLQLTARDVFQKQTVAGLAAIAKKVVAVVAMDDGTGEVEPTPLMRWFLERDALTPDFCQSMAFPLAAGITDEQVRDALAKLVDHHDALRMRMNDGRFAIAPRGSGSELMRTRVERGLLLLTIHHIAVDAVSWRILESDFNNALRGLPLEPVSTSFRAWTRYLANEATLPQTVDELPLWQSIVARGGAWKEGAAPPSGEARTIATELPAQLTTALLTKIPTLVRARVPEVLLAALAIAAQQRVLVDIEGHGRETGTTGLDLSRTVGWFTTIHPAALDAGSGSALEQLRRVQEQLRAIPDNGLRYGLLRDRLQHEPAQIGFNYLGRMNARAAFEDEQVSAPLMHLLELNAVALDGGLSAHWTFDAQQCTEAEVRALAERWGSALASIANELAGLEATYGEIEALLSLTPLQEGLLFHAQYEDSAADVYTVQLSVDLTGPLDAARLQHATESMLRRHANLRAAIVQNDTTRPLQGIARDVRLEWRSADHDVADEERARPFDLARGPLIRFALVQHAVDRHTLIVTNHHLVLDGWSMPVFFEELLAIYGGDEASLPPVRPYAEYLDWLAAQDRDAALAAWRESLADLDGATRIAEGRRGSGRGTAFHDVVLSATLTSSLRVLARTKGLTPNTILQTLWAVLLGRLTGCNDVTFGITVSGRPPDIANVERMIGLFINTVPVRVRIRPGEPIGDLLAGVQDAQSRLLPHHHLGLGAIQQAAHTGELFDTLLGFQNYPVDAATTDTDGELRITGFSGTDATHYPLSVMVTPGDRFELRFYFDERLFTAHDIEAIQTRFVYLLERAAAGPHEPVYRLDARETREWNAPHQPLDAATLPDLFARSVAKHPHAIALTYENTSLTYAELNARANALAHELIAIGAGPETRIAIAIDRSLDMVIAMLAVLKTGAAYLPLDPDYPEARRAQMIEDAQPLTTLRGGEPTNTITVDPNIPIDPNSTAYLLYTSGSTGKPKGVAIPHSSLSTFLQTVGCDIGERLLAVTTIAFDISILELFLPLCRGAEVVLASKEDARDVTRLARLIRDVKPHAMQATPTQWSQLVQHDPSCIDGLHVLTGGEALPRDLARTLHAHARSVRNLYGPTEATIWASAHDVSERDLIDSAPQVVTIGTPLPNYRMYVLDHALEPAPVGVTGELYIAGDALARGYHGLPALTATRFVADHNGTRMYRTGDLARRMHDGTIDFLGRADSQVKIRGFRIEPAEIEAVLQMQPHVAQCTVVVKDSTVGARLIAYIVPAPHTTLDPLALRSALGDQLPPHMVPAAFVVLDSLPLTPNGKLDRRALPDPSFRDTEYRAPRNAEEETLCRLFAETLALDRAGIDDHFFHHGGHSLLATTLISRVRSAFRVELPIRAIYEAPTVAELVTRVRGGKAARPALVKRTRPAEKRA